MAGPTLNIAAAPKPCTARMPISMPRLGDSAQPSEASVNTDSPNR
jgi:hypothetical protein